MDRKLTWRPLVHWDDGIQLLWWGCTAVARVEPWHAGGWISHVGTHRADGGRRLIARLPTQALAMRYAERWTARNLEREVRVYMPWPVPGAAGVVDFVYSDEQRERAFRNSDSRLYRPMT